MKKILLFILLIIVIPTVVITIFNKENIIYKLKYGSINNKVVRVKINKTSEILKVPLEEYVIGVVAGEVPATFNIEALKAQAVASRTYVLKRINKEHEFDVYDNTNNQVYITKEYMKEKWQDNYEINFKRIKKAVLKTKGEVVLYNNDLIDALFFSTSNGYTENAKDVFGGDSPYLITVQSKWDREESPVFYSNKEISKNEFLSNLGLDSANNIDIKNIEKTSSNRIKKIEINNKTFKGTEIRKIFSLRSTCFDIKVDKDRVLFNVSGFGHGVGLSQYGANGMAKEGYDYKKILTYYYKNCEIKKIN